MSGAISASRAIAKSTQSASNARQIAIALIAYANEHDDAYPANLQELVGKELPDDSVLIDPMAPEFGKDGYDYLVPDKNDDDDKVVLVSRGHTKRGERSVAHKDGSVKREKYAPKPDL